MGNNAAFRQFEAAVIAAYDSNVLTLELLDKLGEQWRGTDIDSGGSEDLTSTDELDIFEVIVRTINPELFAKLQESPGDETYSDEIGDAFIDITSDRWGWR